MNDIVRGVAELVEHNTQLELENKMLRATRVDSERFYNVPMPLEMVGLLHGVSAKVIRRLVSLGLIAKHPQSTDSKILIRVSDAIRIDIDSLKQQAKHLSYV